MGLLGKVKVDDVIRIPAAVKRFFDLEEGDYLEFYSDSRPNSINVRIVRKEKEK